MLHDHIDLKTVKNNFLREINDAKSGKSTSLPFILHKISNKPIVDEREIFQVLVIGGTIFQKALVKKEGKNIRILEKEEKYQPAFKHKDDFENFIEKEISPDVKHVALNFAYNIKPVSKKNGVDGIFVSASKGNIFDSLVGKAVGTEVEKLIYKKRKQKISVSVANDTICLLMAGLTRYKESEISAGVVGTGLNFAFFIGKNEAVNLEAGSFNKFRQTPEARLIDLHSTNPGRALFEKEVAGAYLYKHFNLINEAKGLGSPSLHSTQELDQLALQNNGEPSKIAKELLFNSASLVATQIAGIMEFKAKNLVFIIEGSLFWLSDGYRKNVQKVLAQICPQHKAKFVKIENSTVLGAAKLIS